MENPARVLWFLLACLPTAHAAKKPAAPKAPQIAPLRVLERYTVPAVEISGMAWRTNPDNKARELVLVGDRTHELIVIDWEKRKAAFEPRKIAVAEAPIPDGQSEFESVFCDESGRVFIVRESPPSLLVMSADLKGIEARVDLRLDAPVAANSGAEGSLPLRNGHLLLVQEKEPLQLLELGPAGDQAQGYTPALSLEKSGRWPLSASEKPPALTTLFRWRFDEAAERLFEDSSGVNADLDGNLYLLGDQRNLIGRIGDKLHPKKDRLKLSRLWSLPSEIRQPEGMVIDEQHRPIVAIDSKKINAPNLFVLEPLR